MPHIKPFDYVMHTCGIWWINGSIICKSIHISVIPESNTGSIITQYWWHILFRPLVILLFNWILIFIKIFLWIITTALSRFSKKISNKQMCSVSKSKMDKMYTKKLFKMISIIRCDYILTAVFITSYGRQIVPYFKECY